MTQTATDNRFMEKAVELAKQAHPSPNPRVGAVLVKNGNIIGAGYHERPGAAHAEIVALKNAGENAAGADLYVTLEPCIHTGRTGPCVEAVIRAGIARVYVGITDPDVRVNGQGIAALKNAGIQVVTDVLKEPCTELLSSYITHRTLGRPRVTLKAAVTLDGCIATDSGNSKWITSKESRKLVHEMRADADAVLVGIGTVLADNPALTVRDASGPTPLRIVLDSTLKIPDASKLLQETDDGKVVLAYAHADELTLARFQKFVHVECLKIAMNDEGGIRIEDLLIKLGERGILSLLVEGGRRINGAFLRSETVDEIALFLAPKVLGGGIGWTDYPHATTISAGLELSPKNIARIGDDLLYRATVRYPEKSH